MAIGQAGSRGREHRVRSMAVWVAATIAIAVGGAYAASDSASHPVRVLTLDDPITPVTAQYLVAGIESAEKDSAAAIVIEMDTPGGLADAMRRIVKTELNANVPIVVYVSPPGSHAASAGVFITMAAHVAAMAPGTNIGSASVVSIGGAGMDSTMARKVNNDAVAFLQGIAHQRGRNADWAPRFVLEAQNITSEKAVSERVVDFVAPNFAALLDSLDGRTIQLPSGPRTLHVAGAEVQRRPMGLRQRALGVLVNPSIAYILMLLGIYGLFFELSNPGAVLPGVLGAISLLLAFFAFQSLPTNYAGVGLILLGIALMIVEVKVTSFGLLAVGGIASLVLGSLILFDATEEWARLSLRVIIPMTMVTAGFFILCVWLVIRGHRRRPTTGRDAMVGETGRVVVAIEGADRRGKVIFHGETWDATCETPLPAGATVEVMGFSGRIAHVRPGSR